MRFFPFGLAVLIALSGCGEAVEATSDGTGGTGDAGGAGGGSGGVGGSGGSGGAAPFVADLSHTFSPVFVDSGREIFGVCQSWTLNNEEPLYVQGVRQTNEGAWHHSVWTYATEGVFDGPDGNWSCYQRGYNAQSAAEAGGIIFNQSTQAFTEIQAFAEGAVVVLPPRSRIIGNIHLLNVSASPIDTTLTMELDTIPAEEVTVRLRPISLRNTQIAAQPGFESRFSVSCNLSDLFTSILQVGEMPSYNMYYVLGHYHGWGNYFSFNFVNPDESERTIVEFSSQPGDVLGVKLDPPLGSQGAVGLRLTCGYNNTGDKVLTWGIGDLEMCAAYAYIDADLAFEAFPSGDDALVPLGEDEENRLLYDMSGCSGFVASPFTD
ncbi:MAG: hypothetical protein OES69_03780 [Myxococcales bacterium]|nr:hypothetical protein [Myxococcales bacterium]MDH3843032.1 hypothetical protein [Myxococcales bacterium]